MTTHRSLLAMTAALGTICLGLTALLQSELDPIEISAEPGKPVAAHAIRPLPAEMTFAMPPIEKFSAIVERPIFSPNRRPAA